MKSNSTWSLLVNPFTRIAGWKATWIGISATLVGALIFALVLQRVFSVSGPDISSFFPADFTFGQMFGRCLLIFFAGAMFDTLLMWTASVILKKRSRFIDLLGTATLSTMPVIPLCLILLLLTPAIVNAGAAGSLVLTLVLALLLLALSIVCMVWSYALMFNGYKVSTGLSGNKLLLSFFTIICTSLILTFITEQIISVF